MDEWGREGVKSHRESHAVDAVQVEGKLSSNALTYTAETKKAKLCKQNDVAI